MKKLALLALPVVFATIFVVMIPFGWFMVAPEMTKAKVYELCGEPTSTTLWDIKGEYWKETGLGWEWAMFVGFNTGYVSGSQIYLDIGKYPYDIRVYVMDNGKWNVHK